jgi:hypothetical protein
MATPAKDAHPAPSAPDVQIVEVLPDGNVLATLNQSEIRMQFEMARAYPRSISSFQRTVRQAALLDEETAASCFYVLPRRDREENERAIEGPSARFAEIVAWGWGHLFVDGRIVDELERFVVCRGTAWDIQQNVRIAYEVRRRITTSGKRGQQPRRYSDDMIAVTANAASSIALRNAVLKIVPAPLWRPIWLECKKAAVGDLKTLAQNRRQMLDAFQKLGVVVERVFAAINVQTEADITLDHLTELRGMYTALREGETSIDEAFPEIRPGQGPVRMPQRDSAPSPQTSASVAPLSGSAPVVPSTAPPSEPAPDVMPDDQQLRVTHAEDRKSGSGKTFRVARLATGDVVVTFSETLAKQLVVGARFGSIKTRKSGDWTHVVELVPHPAGGAQ